MILRDYQLRARAAVLDAFKEGNSTLLVLPTGAGKTIVFASLIKAFFPRRAMVIAHRQELIFQARDKIRDTTGLTVEVEMGEHRAAGGSQAGLFGRRSSVIVSTIQTHTAGGDGMGRMGKFDPTQFGLLIIDEAHHSTSASFRRMIDYYRSNPALKVLGVTATPDRGDEEALGQVFETVAMDYEILDAINDGWLVPISQQMVFAGDLDLSSVRTQAGDLNGADLAAVLESEKVLHQVATPSIEIIGDKRTLCFTASVKQAEQLSEIFNRHRPGMSAWVCGKTDKDERKKINADFNDGKIQVLCNCGTHTEGFDSPAVEVIIMAKPTKSRSLYAQMVGRSTRPLPGIVDGPTDAAARKSAIEQSAKPSCLVVDFVGNAGRHKLVTACDILGGNVSEDVVESVTRTLREGGKPVRVDVALAEEEEQEKEREQKRLAEEARRSRLVAKVGYSRQSVDPFDVLQIQPCKPRGWDNGKQLSEKQRNFLRKSGLDPDTLNYSHAKQLIGEMIGRFDKHLCSLRQASLLKKFGYPIDGVTFEQASATIDALKKNNWKKPSVPDNAQPAYTPAVAEDDNCPF